MNRHPTTIRARALAALLLLAVLWPLGMGSSRADDAGQASAAPSASGAASATGRSSAPSVSVSHVATEIPVSLRGRWTPNSSYVGAIEKAGPITLGARTLRWSICGKAARRIKPLVTNNGQQKAYPAVVTRDVYPVKDDEQLVLIDLTANGAPPCKFDDGSLLTHLRLRHGGSGISGANDICEMQVTMYGRDNSHSAKTTIQSWGTFSAGDWCTSPERERKRNTSSTPAASAPPAAAASAEKPTSAALPASATAPTVGPPASVASASSAAAAPLAASVPSPATEMPVSLRGKWWASTEAFDMARPLTLGARTLRWYICGKATRRIKPLVTNNGQQKAYPAIVGDGNEPVRNDEQLVLIDLTANGAPPCKFYPAYGAPLVTHLRLRHGSSLTSPDDICSMQMTLYGHDPHSTKTEVLGSSEFVIDKWSAKTCPVPNAAELNGKQP